MRASPGGMIPVRASIVTCAALPTRSSRARLRSWENDDDQTRSSPSIPSPPVALVRAIPGISVRVFNSKIRRSGRSAFLIFPIFLLFLPGRVPMARIHHSLPAKGTRIGIAFSGGLDTRTAVAWMSRNGLDVHAYTADLAQPDEKSVDDIPPIALSHGARVARLVDCREAMVREGVTAVQCGAFHLTTGGKRYFNTTPSGRAVTTTASSARCGRTASTSSPTAARTRATTSSGSSGTACWSTRTSASTSHGSTARSSRRSAAARR